MKFPQKKFGLFLDAGFAHCGVAVFNLRTKHPVHLTCLRTQKQGKERLSEENIRRCREIAYQLYKLTKAYPQIELVCAEFPHGGAQSAKAMSMMSMATAIVTTFAATVNLPLYAVTPTEIKKLVRPKGAVTKQDVENFVEKFFGLTLPKKKEIREHIADSLGCAVVAFKKYSEIFS